ncbi:MAG: hypothetical protein OEZ68_07465 [Gammaproteobacteria bacterium]|nr:hypothetical protein [Gammaproteobacteria bacterium]MDH5800622.1 hypothetical protein [Gammaproteobacteria bacterium]
MMQLPRALRPWAQELSLFPEDVALSLGGLVHKLSLLFGRLDSMVLQGLAEPDGYSGLQSKPVYERLLLSEWLLAEELPEEFDRRAVMGEHLFLKRHTKHSDESRFSVILLDCGPLFVGAPRLLQLALIIFLQRRALQKKVGFRWGVLQQPGILHEEVSQKTLSLFIKSRSSLCVSPESSQQWCDTLNSHSTIREFWLVAAQVIQCDDLQVNHINIEDELIPGERRLSLTLQYGNHVRNSTIELPDDAMCARIIRDPFYSTQNYRQQAAFQLSGSIIFCGTGRKIAVSALNVGAAVYPVPNSASAKTGIARVFAAPPQHEIVAVQTQKRRIFVISESHGQFYCHNFPGANQQCMIRTHGETNMYVDVRRSGYRPLFVFSLPGYSHCAFFLDDALQLFKINFGEEEVKAIPVDDSVSAVMVSALGLSYVKVESQDELLLVKRANSYRPEKETIGLEETTSGQVFLGCDHHQKDNVILAVENGEKSHWHTVGGSREQRIEVSPNVRVVGVVRLPPEHWSKGGLSGSGQVVLVAFDAIDGRVFLLDQRGENDLIREEGIAEILFDPVYVYIAYTLVSGEVKVFSLLRNEVVLIINSDQTND